MFSKIYGQQQRRRREATCSLSVTPGSWRLQHTGSQPWCGERRHKPKQAPPKPETIDIDSDDDLLLILASTSRGWVNEMSQRAASWRKGYFEALGNQGTWISYASLSRLGSRLIQATAARSGHTFRAGGNTVTKKRSRMSPDTIRQVVCLKSWGVISGNNSDDEDVETDETISH